MAVRTAGAAARHPGEGLTPQRPACCVGGRESKGGEEAHGEAHEEERLRQLQEILSAWPAFGLFSLFATHPLVTRGVSGLPWWRAVCLKLAPLVLLATQLVAPPLLLVTLAAGGEGGWCPATAPPVDRCLVCAVALLALARCWSGAYAHAHAHAHARAHAPPQRDGHGMELGAASVRVHAARRRRREESGLERSLLGEVGRLDAALQPSLAALASLAGLALVYAAQGAASILLCVLSAEVFARLGGQYKAWYLEARGDALLEILAWRLGAAPFLHLGGGDGLLQAHPAWLQQAAAPLPPRADATPRTGWDSKAHALAADATQVQARLGPVGSPSRYAELRDDEGFVVREARGPRDRAAYGSEPLVGPSSPTKRSAAPAEADAGAAQEEGRTEGCRRAAATPPPPDVADVTDVAAAWRRHRLGTCVGGLVRVAGGLARLLGAVGPCLASVVLPGASLCVLVAAPLCKP